MSSHEDDLDAGEPPTIDPYEVLGLERSASADQVKTAYRKAALKNHPGRYIHSSMELGVLACVFANTRAKDKAEDDKKAEATEKFQSVAFAYAILSDPARRKRYDETGSTSESIVDSEGFSWSDFYREQFRDSISADAIQKFADKYKNSDEEKDDVLAAYETYEGNMDQLYGTVMLSDVLEDDDRFRAIIDEAIASGDVEAFPAYANETKKARQARIKNARREAQREGKEAEEYAKKLGVHDKLFGSGKKKSAKDSEADLAALIRRNQQGRAGALDMLAEKYGAVPKGKGGKKRHIEEPDIDEEEFQAIQARMAKGPAGKKAKKRT